MKFDSLKLSDELVESMPAALFAKVPLERPIVELAAAWALEDMRSGSAIRSSAQLAAAIRDRAGNHIQRTLDHVSSSAFATGTPLCQAIDVASAQIWAKYFTPESDSAPAAPKPTSPAPASANPPGPRGPFRRVRDALTGGAA